MRGAIIKIVGIATKYAILHDLNQIFKKLALNPMFTDIKIKDIIPVVITPIIKVNATLFFIFSTILS